MTSFVIVKKSPDNPSGIWDLKEGIARCPSQAERDDSSGDRCQRQQYTDGRRRMLSFEQGEGANSLPRLAEDLMGNSGNRRSPMHLGSDQVRNRGRGEEESLHC